MGREVPADKGPGPVWINGVSIPFRPFSLEYWAFQRHHQTSTLIPETQSMWFTLFMDKVTLPSLEWDCPGTTQMESCPQGTCIPEIPNIRLPSHKWPQLRKMEALLEIPALSELGRGPKSLLQAAQGPA